MTDTATVTIITRDGFEEWAADDPRVVAYDALYAAAERIGLQAGAAQLAEHLRRGRRRHTFRYSVPEAQRTLVDAMPLVLAGTITPAEAMGLLWGHDVQIARFGRRVG